MQIIKFLVIGIAGLLLSGCLFQNTPHADLTLHTARYLNPDQAGKSSPVVLSVYQLKRAFAFKNASYIDLMNNSGRVLGTNLIDKQILELTPSQHKKLTIDLSQDTHYIGFVAAFRNIDKAIWHKVIRVKPKENPALNVVLQSQGISVSQHKGGWF